VGLEPRIVELHAVPTPLHPRHRIAAHLQHCSIQMACSSLRKMFGDVLVQRHRMNSLGSAAAGEPHCCQLNPESMQSCDWWPLAAECATDMTREGTESCLWL
jgi:hypothetical protein